jgi:hypothetical protein
MIKRVMADNSLTFRGAAMRTSISAAYWKDMSDGRVPSEDVIDRIAAEFPEVDGNDLRAAAGYSAKLSAEDTVKAVEFALRGQSRIPQEGKDQILEFVKKIERKYAGEES